MCLFPSSFLAGFRRAGSGGECPYPSSGPVDRPEQSWACLSCRRDVSRLRSRLCAMRTNLTPSATGHGRTGSTTAGTKRGFCAHTKACVHTQRHTVLTQPGLGLVGGPMRGCGAGRARSLSRRRVWAQRRRWRRSGLHSPGPTHHQIPQLPASSDQKIWKHSFFISESSECRISKCRISIQSTIVQPIPAYMRLSVDCLFLLSLLVVYF
jgi:hypothetical protein